ncbi:gustatory receptor for sugar taste 64f-like [Trichogramma pretiosum]|uniref:gustatory receptor for sugar taste 64f-like n=1 Tax=Trichogramma pretiosum TaxID=7493 RepID=UPI0006C96BAE|nr:gustatory receptor for sugar taste 64f-like [Trichogramma pretiosum]
MRPHRIDPLANSLTTVMNNNNLNNNNINNNNNNNGSICDNNAEDSPADGKDYFYQPAWAIISRRNVFNQHQHQHHQRRAPGGSAEIQEVVEQQSNRREMHKLDTMPMEGSTQPSAPSNSGGGGLDDPVDDGQRSLHCALRPIIILAQVFAVFPISGVNSSDASTLEFTWRSPKIVYCCLSSLGSLVLTLFSIYRLATTSITSSKTSNLVFFFTAGITTILFLKLARQWPAFAATWQSMERELATRYTRTTTTTTTNTAEEGENRGDDNPSGLDALSLSAKFKVLSTVVMSLALVEHSLSLLSGYVSALECASLRGHANTAATYFSLQFPQIFTESNFALWKGALVQFINVLSTFSWNFMDLFLILLSVALTDQFKQLNRRLHSIRGKHGVAVKTMPEWWWAEARIDFNRLASMTRRVDSQISDIVLLSFSTNLYFICIQLLNSFKPMPNAIQTIYFCFSFGFLLLRTAAVSLYAAAIYDESRLPAPVLYGVCSSNYSTEVRRFLHQVTTDSISLTGMKFFSITRSLILTVAGTIVTYELVLVQFNAVQADHLQSDSNITKVCEVK